MVVQGAHKDILGVLEEHFGYERNRLRPTGPCFLEHFQQKCFCEIETSPRVIR